MRWVLCAQVGLAFSPCMRFVAVGSEDRSAVVYDIRTGKCVSSLQVRVRVRVCVLVFVWVWV